MEDKSSGVFAVATAFMVITIIAFSLRVYVRIFMIKAVGSDDYTMLATLLIYIAFLACELGGVRYGTGRRLKDLERGNAQTALQYWWLCEVFYSPATAMLKVSVGLFLLRITVKKIQIWTIYFFMAGSVVFGLFWMIITILQCRPVSFRWDLNPASTGTCLNPTVFTICAYAVSVLNSSADIAFAVLPMFILRQTTMSPKARLLVCILLGVASVACVATLVRIPYIHTMNNYKGDFLFNTTEVAILSALEIGLGITAACAATLRPLVQAMTGTGGSGYATPRPVVHTAESMHLRQISARSADKLTGIKKKTSVEIVYKGDSWSRLPDFVRSDSVEALNDYRVEQHRGDRLV